MSITQAKILFLFLNQFTIDEQVFKILQSFFNVTGVLATSNNFYRLSQQLKGKVMKLRTPGKFGHTFANSGNPDQTSRFIRIFTVCLVDFFIPIIMI